MTVPQETVWPLEPHTLAKHEILRRYLSAWFPILGATHSRVVYIDGFCGPGRYKGGEPGSPLIALEAAEAHHERLTGQLDFWFFDKDKDRIEHLKRELSARTFPDQFQIHAEVTEFSTKLQTVLDDLDADGFTLAPTFAFIDPFGFSGIPFELVARLLRRQSCEAFITFMVDAVNRHLTDPREAITGHIVSLLGAELPIEIANDSTDRVQALQALYQSQLESVARYVRYFEMRDKDNRIQFYLFFASNSRQGFIKMKEAMWRVDPSGQFSFSDATNPHQLILFANDPTPKLAGILQAKFGGQPAISGEAVRSFVEEQTPFLNPHKTQALKSLETKGMLQVEPAKADGTPRKRGTFPDDAQMRFLSSPAGQASLWPNPPNR